MTTTEDVTTLRDSAEWLRERKHSNGIGAALSKDIAALLTAEADALDEIATETADTEAAGELVVIMSTTAAALAVARRLLDA